MCHTKNTKKRLFTASGARSTRAESARALNLTPDSDSALLKTPGGPKSAQKPAPIMQKPKKCHFLAIFSKATPFFGIVPVKNNLKPVTYGVDLVCKELNSRGF